MSAEPQEEAKADPVLLDWLKDRITLPGFTKNMWTEEHDMVASDFLMNLTVRKLTIYMDKDIGLCMNTLSVASLQKAKHLQYFLKPSEDLELSASTISTGVQFGVISGSAMASLLKLMKGVFLPTFLTNGSWPESVRKDFSGQLHKFMASLTETTNQVKGKTVLYLPSENIEDHEAASQDKDLVQRLESTLIHWTRQIKEVVNNQETSHHVDNSGPLEEIQFWQSRTVDLTGIQKQLDRPGVRDIVNCLKLANSSYLKPFETLSDSIQQGSTEADNNLKFLRTLQEPCERLASASPEEIPTILPEILDLIRMIWTISNYYNTVNGLTGLLRKISTQIIVQCSKKISLSDIFDGDVQASMVQLGESIKCGEAWHKIFDRTVLAISKDPNCKDWSFATEVPSTHGIFAQIDAFVQRCHNLMEVCEGQLQFARKGTTTKSENGRASLPAFGGSRGQEIEKSLYEIEEGFEKHIDRLRALDYDILNVKATGWHHDYNHFKSGLKDLEVMMTNVISSAWESISTVRGGVELLESFYFLAVRSGMKQTVERKTAELYQMFSDEIKKVRTIFDRHKKAPPLPYGYSRYGGAALWAKSLFTRLERDFKFLDAAHYLARTVEADEAEIEYRRVSKMLEGYIRQMHSEWISTLNAAVSEDAPQLQDRLGRCLMIRSPDRDIVTKKPTGHLESNFDKTLIRLFSEVRYWDKFHGDYTIPYNAQEMYTQQDALRILRECVMLVVRDYNTIIDALSPEERRLFQQHMTQVDRKIAPGLAKLSWGDKHIKEWFVKVTRNKCNEVYGIVLDFKNNNQKIADNCERIANTLLVDIEKNTVYEDVDFERKQARHQERVKHELSQAHAEIVRTVQASFEFFVDQNDDKREWVKYVKKIDQQIEDALRHTVKKSLQELSRAINGDAKSEPHPLFKVNMVLDEVKGACEFRPTMQELSTMIKHVSKKSITTIQVVPRLTETLLPEQIATSTKPKGEVKFDGDKPADGDKSEKTLKVPDASAAKPKEQVMSFFDVISSDDDILKILVYGIFQGTQQNVAEELKKIIDHYQRHSAIWTVPKDEYIKRFANSKKHLNAFSMEIQHYRSTQEDIQSEDPAHTVNFIRIECNLIKHSLVSHCQQWQLKLTNLLHYNGKTELDALHAHMTDNTAKLQLRPKDLPELAEAITLLENLTTGKADVEGRFEPVEEIFKCLDKFDVHVSDEEKARLEELRSEWEKFGVTLEQAEERLRVRKEELKRQLETSITTYNQHVVDTRTDFLELGPFFAPGPGEGDPDCDGAFAFIAEYRKHIQDNRDKAEHLKKGMGLFNMTQQEYTETDETEKELNLLEKVWTVMQDYLKKYEAWKVGKFSDLNVKELEKTAAEFAKLVSKMPKKVKAWECHKALTAIIQRFRQTMPLIANLRSEGMRPRHWEQLQEEIGQQFDPTADDFTLEKVIGLGLHNYTEAVQTLATIAQREMNIENNLAEINEIWTNQELDLVPYKTKYYKVRSLEEVNDYLEGHQLQLTTMKNSPYYMTFQKDVNYWMRTLNEVSDTMEALVTVQRGWMYLESIFMDSADIRKQLPAESAQFEKVNNSWIDAMNKLIVDKKALDVLKDGLFERLGRMDETLEKINHSLDQYLEKKRQNFPRFYFLSNDDLLEILGNAKDPTQVQKHIRKFFAGVKNLMLVEPKKSGSGKHYEVIGVKSACTEEMPFNGPVFVEGEVENWLSDVEAMAFETLQKAMYNALVTQKPSTKKAALDGWIKSTLGQLLITGGQITWTSKCHSALADITKAKRGIRRLKSEWVDYLGRLSKMVRGDVSKLDAKKLVALITIEVHARDVIDKLKAAVKNKGGVNSFEWLSQLRFEFDKNNGEHGKAVVKQTNTSFWYGYEYQGNNGRLVITPLTDRCYMTLTTALSLCRGGSPMGPAGTGKTETVKDLGKGMAKMVVVFNCSPEMNVQTCGRNFSGLSQTGAWGCFDEFNRIVVEVLSVVALQVTAILNAIKTNAPDFILDGRTIKLNPTVGIFITMNPAGAGYTGRSKLPDNLASLFRPVSMMVPDTEMIAEIMLLSRGFNSATILAKKIVTIFDLMVQQLSKQSHYSEGLRTIASVLVRAGVLYKAKTAEDTEELIVMRALKDMNHSKLVEDDMPLFDALLGDLFPNLEVNDLEYKNLRPAIRECLTREGLQPHPWLVGKVVQLHENQGTRHGNMLVGGTLGGKTTAWKTLAAALTLLVEKGIVQDEFKAVDTYVLNPKSVTMDELYGNYDPVSKEWTDGIMSAQMRKACMSETENFKWIILDGPVDTLWIESMNTVLDDNKVLTLVNGDRISMPPQVSLVFEVEDLAVASPATVSRAGIIYLDQTMLGWRPYVQTWMDKKMEYIDKYGVGKGPEVGGESQKLPPLTKDAMLLMEKLISKYCVPLFAVKDNDEIAETIPILEFNAMMAFTRLFDALATQENGVDPADEANYNRMLEMWFTFCVVWSIGGAANEAGRIRVDAVVRDIESQYPPLQTVYEYYIDANKKDWVLWDEKVNNAWKPKKEAQFFDIVVPTVDTLRYTYLMNALISNNAPIIVSGSTGTGKTAYTVQLLNNLDSNYNSFTLNFSAATLSSSVQQQLESRLEKRQRNNFGPKNGKKSLVVFVDDLNMPQKDEYGSQPPIELLRQYQDYGFWYDRQKQSIKNIQGMQLIGGMGPPGGARSVISARFQARFNVINFCFPHENNLSRIFRTLITNHLSDFDESVKSLSQPITTATIELYNQVVEDFLPTPSCCHYLFNMRDISKVFQGLLQSSGRFYDTKESMCRLWVHECMRVFHDRLINNDDKEKFLDIVNNKLNSLFQTSWKKLFPGGEEPLFADFLEDEVPAVAMGGDEEDEENPYVEVTTKLPKVRAFCQDKLEAYNEDPDSVKADMVLFDNAVIHICRIYRVIRQPRGCVMLVGVGGSGRQSCARLATYMAQMKTKQIQPTKNYRPVDFHEDMKELFRQTGMEQEPTVFLFSDTQIVHPSFIEDINNILNSGEIPKLFPDDELVPLLEELRADAMKLGLPTNSDSLYQFFIDRVRTNLHVILAMSPVGVNFRNYCRMFPALVNCCAIDWFNEWPEDALQAVAERYLKDIEFEDEKVRKGVATCFSVCHMSAIAASKKMLEVLKRTNYVTPTKYLDLVQGYCQLLTEKRKEIGSQKNKLSNGLQSLDDAKEAVATMTIELEEKNVIVAQKKKDCETLMTEIVIKQRTAEEQKKQVAVDKARTETEVKAVNIQKEDALADLQKAEPALEKAVIALSKLTKNSVTEVKSYSKPPKAVEKTMSAVMVVFEKEATWTMAKKELGDPQFLTRMKNFDKDNISNKTLKEIGKYTKQKEFNADEVGKISVAAGAMCEWVCAMEMYAKVYREVEPKRIALAKAMDNLARKQEALAAAEKMLQDVMDMLAGLEKKLKDAQDNKEKYEAEANMLQEKLQRAADVVSLLGGERERWESSIKKYDIDILHLVGDCAIAAAFMSYAGPFTADYRDDLVKQEWDFSVRKNNLPYTKGFKFSDFMANATDVMDWNIQGLPSDDFSTENGVLVQRGMRWPLMIDPQGQANQWIKEKERGELKVCDFQTAGYMRVVEQAVQYGAPLLIEDILEEVDPAMESLLRLTTDEKPRSVMMGDKEISFTEGFRLFFTTKLSNPHYQPELAIKVTLINFAVKMKGLEAQLLALVVQMESAELEKEKAECVKTVAAGKRKITELEDSILTLLSTSGDNILDDPELSVTLKQSKLTSQEVTEQVRISNETGEKIDLAREGYRPSATRASLIYFVLNDLAMVDPMYQFSLKSYIDLFRNSIEKSIDGKDRDAMDVIDRLHQINNYHTEAVYKHVCMALFEKHKLLFAFKLCVEKMKSEDKIDAAEYDFFLKGGIVMDRSKRAENPVSEFVSEQAWDSITVLDELPAFKGLANSFETNSSDWLAWFRSEDPPPEKLAPPGEWQNKRDDFQNMLVLRCLRPDRVVFAARTFIAQNLGQQYVEPPAFNLKATFDNSKCTSPLIFVLSPGVDPIVTLQALASQVGAELDILALGQGQTPIALRLLEKGMKNGNWVFLANCHLSISWLPDLEKIVDRMAAEKPHKDFRLWLSSDPHPKFPISLLQTSVKMTTEPPKGLRANLLRLYTTNMTDETFERSRKPEKFKKLIFCMCFFHAVMIERKKFLSLGWNIMYDFNESDFSICENLLQVYLDQYDATPWDALKYLIAQANYGGRVTDDQDRKLLVVYANQYFCEAALTVPRFQLSSIDKYYVPEDGVRESYIKYVKTLPDAADDPPEAFGQHSNADIASQMEATKVLLDTILALQPRDVAAPGAKTPEETALEIIDNLKSQIQPPMEWKRVSRKFQSDKTPLTVVLLQELSRYNKLLNIVHTDLDNLKLGLKGLVVISSELERVFNALLNGKVPHGWLKIYLSIKNLGPWTRDLVDRVDFFLKWSENGPPKVFWLSAFTFPTGFLTALLQNTARRNATAIDALSWDFIVMTANEQSIGSVPKDGAYVQGLFLEGARWDVEAGCLAEPYPMELVCPMPIIHFKPVENRKKGSKGLHSVPMYLYPIRTGSRERPSFQLEVDLKAGARDTQHWTKRGTALLLSLDA